MELKKLLRKLNLPKKNRSTVVMLTKINRRTIARKKTQNFSLQKKTGPVEKNNKKMILRCDYKAKKL